MHGLKFSAWLAGLAVAFALSWIAWQGFGWYDDQLRKEIREQEVRKIAQQITMNSRDPSCPQSVLNLKLAHSKIDRIRIDGPIAMYCWYN
jgi:hypothetical protein